MLLFFVSHSHSAFVFVVPFTSDVREHVRRHLEAPAGRPRRDKRAESAKLELKSVHQLSVKLRINLFLCVCVILF